MSLANKLTMARIALIPFFIIALEFNWFDGFIALAIFIAASLTDSLDGFVARKYNQITTFGKLIDPLADKLLISSAVIYLTSVNVLPVWVAVVIIARDFTVTSLRLIAINEGEIISAHLSGKVRTAVNSIFIIMFLVPLSQLSFWTDSINNTVNMIAGFIMAAVSIWSCADYIYRGRGVINFKV